MIQDLEIEDEDIPHETHDHIRNSVKSFKKIIKKIRKKEEVFADPP